MMASNFQNVHWTVLDQRDRLILINSNMIINVRELIFQGVKTYLDYIICCYLLLPVMYF